MTILDPRVAFSPFEYEQAYIYTTLQQQSHWLASEVSLAADIDCFKTKLSSAERALIGHILKGFTQTEVFIQDYWSTNVTRWFKKPEVQMMATTFASFEVIHAISYSLLDESLGLTNYTAFLDEPTARAKIDRLLRTGGKTPRDIARSLAIFSAFNEGVNLFSSFAILRNFSRFNKMKGLGQIIDFSQKDECFSDDTEILTPLGWKRFDLISDRDHVAQVDPDTGEVSFVKPSRIVSNEIDEDVVEFSCGKLPYRSKVTKNHRIPSKWDYQAKYSFDLADDLKLYSKRFVRVAGFKSGGRERLSDIERFQVATQADGTVSERYTGVRAGTVPVIFRLAKQRKKDRLEALLGRLGWAFKTTSDKPAGGNKKAQTKYTVDVPVTVTPSKTFDWVNLAEVSSQWCDEFIEEARWWDGYVPKDGKTSGYYTYYSSTILKNVEKVQAIAALCGRFATLSKEEDHRSETFNTVHRLYIHKKDTKRLGGVQKDYVPYKGKVYCVTVPTSAVLVRYKGAVSVSGNCLHSQAGCWLFRTLVGELPEIWTDELKEEIYEAARVTVELEDAFINKAFDVGSVEGITAADMKAFIRYRCNTKLQDLGLKSNWRNIDKGALANMEWFDVLSKATSHDDFFASRVTDYAKGNIDFSGIWDDDEIYVNEALEAVAA